MKIHIELIAVLLASTILSGCSTTGGQIASFEDLTTESKKEGFVKIPQYRVISIPGLLPFSDIGGVHFYKANRKPSSAIGLSNGKSYSIETTINSTCDENCLSLVRWKILLVKSAAANLIEDKVNLTRLRSNQPSASSTDSERTAFQTTIISATDKYNTTRTDLDTKYQDAVKSINNNGILVFRWNTNTNISGSIGLGAILGSSWEKDETQSGFGLISGLKISTLYVGDDILKTWGNINKQSKYHNRYEITTYTMQAQKIMYMSEQDLSSSLRANLKASYSQLSNISDTIKALDNIEIQAALSKVSNLSNMGVIGNSKRSVIDVNWSNPNSISTPSSHDGWQTIYSVKSDLTDVLEMVETLHQETKPANKALQSEN